MADDERAAKNFGHVGLIRLAHVGVVGGDGFDRFGAGTFLAPFDPLFPRAPLGRPQFRAAIHEQGGVHG